MPTARPRLLGAFQVLWMLKPAVAASTAFVVLGTYFSQSRELLLRLVEQPEWFGAFLSLTLPLLMLMMNLHLFNAVRLWRRITRVHRANIIRLPHQALLSPGAVPYQTALIGFCIVAAPLLAVAFTLREGFVILMPDPLGLRGVIGAAGYDLGLITVMSVALGYYYWWSVGQIKWFEKLEMHTADTLHRLQEVDVREQRRQPGPDELLSHEKMPDGRDLTLRNLDRHVIRSTLGSFALGVCVILVISALNLASAVTGGDVSAFGVLGCFLGGFVLLYSTFDVMPSKLKWLIASAVIAVAVVLHALKLGGSEYRQLADTTKADRGEQPGTGSSGAILESAFIAWLKSRPDYDEFGKQGRKYPVFVVSAQGGGIAAAYHVAGFLALVQDRCASFAPHIFAISSVSGGSLGSAAFAATADRSRNEKPAAPPGKCLSEIESERGNRAALRGFLAHNYLSAPLTALFGFDLPLGAVGLPLNPFDRAVALEMTIENVWSKSARADGSASYFSEGIKGAWQPSSTVPMIMYNATLVDRGEPLLISPIGWSYRSRSGTNGTSLFDLQSSDLRASTAVVLSARFPYLAPPAVVRIPEMARIGDGAYFDNSGIVSAAELVLSLSATVEARKLRDAVDLYLVSFVDEVARTTAGSSFGEIVSPIDAVQRVRERRASELIALYADLPVKKWWRLPLSRTDFEPPLGWAISSRTMGRIEDIIATGSKREIDEIVSVLESN